MKEKRAMKCPGPGWKKRRDPNYPPANLTAYMHYAKETRDAVVATPQRVAGPVYYATRKPPVALAANPSGDAVNLIAIVAAAVDRL